MGQKVHPYGFRVGYSKPWLSRWFARHQAFADYLFEDAQIRRHLKQALKTAAVARVEIERAANRVRVGIHTAKPGIIIGRRGDRGRAPTRARVATPPAKPGIIVGRRGADIDRLRDDLHALTKREVYV